MFPIASPTISPGGGCCTRASTLLLLDRGSTSTDSHRPRQSAQLTVPVCKQHHSTTMAVDDIASHYQVLEELGRGSFGVVYKGIERATGETVAIKHVSSMIQPFRPNSPAEPG